MPRANPLISSLNAGELSSRMLARTDFAKYRNGCRTLENMLPLAQGGATRRPGLRFVAEVKDSTKKVLPLPFEFSTEQAYVIEAGEGYCRFYRNQGRITVAGTAATITNGTFDGSITGWTDQSGAGSSIAHDAPNGRLSLISNGTTNAHAEQQVANSAAQEHVLRFRVFGLAGDAVTLRLGATTTGAEIIADTEYAVGYHAVAFTSTAVDFFVQFLHATAKTLQIDDVSLIDNAPVDIGTPYQESDLFSLRHTQSADTLYIAHNSHPPMKLLRFGHTAWSLVEIALTDGPYFEINTDTVKTLTPSATTGLGITLTASGHSPFAATDVGRLVRVKHGASWGYARISGFTSATQVTADVKSDFGGATASSEWRLGAWSRTTGYPCSVTFHRQRLYFAGSVNEPDRLWGSKIGDFETFTPGTLDDDPVDFTISSDQVNAIRWMAPAKQLAIGTTGGEYVMRASTLDEPITPISIQIVPETTVGCADIAPARVNKAVLFMQRHGRKLQEFVFSFESDGFRSPDLTIMADHVTQSGIVHMAFQAEPDPTVFCVRGDGVIASLAYKREEEVVGWARQITNGAFEGVTVIPGAARDETWCIVRRTIGGQTKRYVEFIESGDVAVESDAFFVDSGLTYNGAPASAITGLDHLEGEEVQILADGAVTASQTVQGGQIILATPASKVHAGLGYTSVYQSLKLEAGAPAGTAQGQPKRFHGVTLLLLDSGSVQAGPARNDLQVVPSRSVDDPMDAPPPLFSGEKYVSFKGDFETDPRIFVVQGSPLPLTLLGLVPHLKTGTR